ncbi:ABC transporter substrate-binding protein [Vibrio profundi]|uniref:ABC transporter substrate-binding protein n=1 Tax=Vibrio profundi TaxID=1774960 RepID=UPI003736DFF8
MKACLSLIFCLLAAPVFGANVLVIESYHSEYPWDQDYVEGLSETINPQHHIHTFQMDTKRLPESEYPKMADKAYLYYHQIKPKVVILGDDNALKYMLPKLYKEPITIVFLGINSNPRKLLSRYQGKAKITGVLEQPLLIKSINEIGNLLPNKQGEILVLFDSGVTSKIAKKFISQKYQSVRGNLKAGVEIKNVKTKDEWKNLVSQAKHRGFSAIVIGLYHTLIDSDGNNVDSNTVMAWTNQHSPVPIFGFWDFSVGKGMTAGGVVLFGKSQGEDAGKMVNQVLSGTETNQVPIHIGKQGKAIYSPFEMKRWGLTPPTHWEAISESE